MAVYLVYFQNLAALSSFVWFMLQGLSLSGQVLPSVSLSVTAPLGCPPPPVLLVSEWGRRVLGLWGQRGFPDTATCFTGPLLPAP